MARRKHDLHRHPGGPERTRGQARAGCDAGAHCRKSRRRRLRRRRDHGEQHHRRRTRKHTSGPRLNLQNASSCPSSLADDGGILCLPGPSGEAQIGLVPARGAGVYRRLLATARRSGFQFSPGTAFSRSSSLLNRSITAVRHRPGASGWIDASCPSPSDAVNDLKRAVRCVPAPFCAGWQPSGSSASRLYSDAMGGGSACRQRRRADHQEGGDRDRDQRAPWIFCSSVRGVSSDRFLCPRGGVQAGSDDAQSARTPPRGPDSAGSIAS